MSGVPCGGSEGGQPVLVRNDAVERGARREVTGPLDEARYAVSAFPTGILLTVKGRGAGVRPRVEVRAVVGGVLDDGVVGEAEVVNELEQFADVQVVLDHAVVVFIAALAADAFVLGLHVSAEVHARAVPPAEEGLPGFGLASDEFLGDGYTFIVHGLHALLGERAGIFNSLATLAVGLAFEHATRAEGLAERLAVRQLHVAGIVAVLRL